MNNEDLVRFVLSKISISEHHINSFNNFLRFGMQRVVDEVKEIVPDILPAGVRDLRIRFGRIWVDKPSFREADGTRHPILPTEARLRNLTYEAPIFLEMTLVQDGEEMDTEVVHIGEMPIMVKSEACYLSKMSEEEMIKAGEDPSDPGGYFIVNGTERVVVIVEDLCPNRIFVDKQRDPSRMYVAKIFSEDGQYNIPHTVEKAKDGVIYVSFTRLQRIPFAILMKALGFKKDKDIIEAIGLKDSRAMGDLYINLYEAKEIKNEEQALAYLGKKAGIMVAEKRVERAEEIIDRFFLPHLGHSPLDRRKKGLFLGRMIKRLLLFSYGEIGADDKDHYKNKRVRLAGELVESLFRVAFRMLVGDMKYNFERLVKRSKLPKLQSIVRSQFFTQRMRSALATGEWVGERTGISQHLDRQNYYATVSHLRRVVSLLTTSRENFEARDLHPTHWGRLCTSETPEGPNVGLRKNLALGARITQGVSEDEIIPKLKEVGLKEVE